MKYLLFFFLILLVLVRYFLTSPTYREGDFLKIETQVLVSPIRYSASQYLKIRGLRIYLPLYPEISYSDRVVIEGRVVGDSLKEAKLLRLQKSKNLLFNFRERLLSIYRQSLPEPHASLLSGIVLGVKSDLPASFWKSLRKSGTAHVVVASGMNVTFTAGFLLDFLILFLKRRVAAVLAISGIWLYTIVSGLEAPIVRAAIMSSASFLAIALGRLYDAKVSLILAALVMLVVNPSWMSDIGFILSFVASLSLMVFQSKIDRLMSFVPRLLRDGFSTSLAAQIGVAPILYLTFGQFNLLSPLINALVLWTIPYIMIIGVVGGLVGLIIPLISRLILYISFPLTSWFIWLVNVF